MKKDQYVKVDSKNRVCLTKFLKNMPDIFRVQVEPNKIVLEVVQEIPERERWLFEPENREILERVRRGLKESKSGAKTYSLDDVEKMLNLKD